VHAYSCTKRNEAVALSQVSPLLWYHIELNSTSSHPTEANMIDSRAHMRLKLHLRSNCRACGRSCRCPGHRQTRGAHGPSWGTGSWGWAGPMCVAGNCKGRHKVMRVGWSEGSVIPDGIVKGAAPNASFHDGSIRYSEENVRGPL